MRYANEIIVEELKNDREFLKVHICHAITSLFNKEFSEGCLMIRDIVNATIGFKELSLKLNKSDKALMQMLAKSSNPTIENLFSIISAVLEHERLSFANAEITDIEAA
jgi:DNA-binding phage protein